MSLISYVPIHVFDVALVLAGGHGHQSNGAATHGSHSYGDSNNTTVSPLSLSLSFFNTDNILINHIVHSLVSLNLHSFLDLCGRT